MKGLNMGIGPFRSESHRGLLAAAFSSGGSDEFDRREVFVDLPNPNPENFTIERVQRAGSYVCALVHYPDATNFEGRKVIVFNDTTEEDVTGTEVLDPHFAEDGNIIARFRPDEEGWQDALSYADFKAGYPGSSGDTP